MKKTENTHRKYYSLLELTRSVESVIKKTYTQSYWVKAEIAKLNYYPKSGHCYPDLVEKDNGIVLAQIRATIWAGPFNDINNKFIKVTGEALSDGITVLFRASVNFHPVYGFGLQISDIEPSFTLGEMAKEKLLSIEKLKKEGLFTKNKQLIPGLLLKRLAVISVETSKGYQDFLEVIDNNDWGYHFFHMLFPALLQGIGAIKSISEQLNRIKKVLVHFDAVLIIRGGGGDVGLSSFDNYQLASAVARFPLPVITGIGHATNETVVEQVSFVNKITPTEVAYYLIQRFHNYSVRVQDSQNKIIDKTKQISVFQKQNLQNIIRALKSNTDSLIYDNRGELANYKFSVTQLVNAIFDEKKNSLHHSEIALNVCVSNLFVKNNFKISSLVDKVKLLEPKNILKRGYSITTHKGKAVLNGNEIEPGDELETYIYDGKITSSVTKIKKHIE